MASRLNALRGLFVVCAGIASSAAVAADTQSPPDFSGVYQVRFGYGVGMQRTTDGQPIPEKDWVVKEMKFIQDTEAKGTPIPRSGQVGWPKGFVHASKSNFNFLLIQNPEQISWFFEEDSQYSFTLMNAKHAAHPKPTFQGDTVGHWEGDTLVIDMIGLNGRTPLVSLPITEKAHITMRLRQIDGGKSIENVVHIDDPDAYTRPWDTTIVYDRAAPGTRVYESVYAENQRDVPDLDLLKKSEAPKDSQ